MEYLNSRKEWLVSALATLVGTILFGLLLHNMDKMFQTVTGTLLGPAAFMAVALLPAITANKAGLPDGMSIVCSVTAITLGLLGALYLV